MKTPELDYYIQPVTDDDGNEGHIVMAFGNDGTMWIDPNAVGIRPDDIEALSEFPGPPVLFDFHCKRVLVNARAVVLVKTNPEFRRQWLAYCEFMIQEHQQFRTRYESTRNH